MKMYGRVVFWILLAIIVFVFDFVLLPALISAPSTIALAAGIVLGVVFNVAWIMLAIRKVTDKATNNNN